MSVRKDVIRTQTDLVVVGAGPAGLYAAYYAGFRGFGVAVVDSLEQVGGQVSALYPEKLIYDVAGFPSVRGQDLVNNLKVQADTFSPVYFLGHRAEELVVDQHAESVSVTTSSGHQVTARAAVLTGGIGTFSPRPLPQAEGFEGLGLMYFVPKLSELSGLDVVIVGGGDSAFDWALSLEPLARSVSLVHRRDRFRAHAHTVDLVERSSVRIRRSSQVKRVLGEQGRIARVEILNTPTGEVEILPVQALVAALGFTADLGPLKQWGIAQSRRKVIVDRHMATSLPRVYAAGDIAGYEGKVDLISVGFGEAAVAVNNAAPLIDPSARVAPGHSSAVSTATVPS